MKSYVVATIFLILSFPVQAGDAFYILGGIGSGETSVKSKYQVNDRNEEKKSFDYQIILGYQTKNNFLIEAGYINHGSLDVFGMGDNTDVAEAIVMAGYAVPIGKYLKITPRIGYAWWRVKSTEGALFNSGPEAKKSLNGNEFSYMIGASFKRMYFSYQNIEYKFGSIRSTIVGIKIDL